MVEASNAVPEPPKAPAFPPADQDVKMCDHPEDLATYCRICDIALCNDCYFEEHSKCGKGMTLKQAATL